jgi:hypothetical protein
MVKRFLLIITMCSVISGYCQTRSKAMVLGGGISREKLQNEYGYDDHFRNSYEPSFGYFLASKFCLGIDVVLRSETDVSEYNGRKRTFNAFGAAPFGRYYKSIGNNENFYFITQAKILFVKGEYNGASGYTTNSAETEITLSPGFAYFISRHWSAELMFRGIGFVSSDRDTDSDGYYESYFDYGLNSLSPSLGIRYYFNNRIDK